MEPKRESRLAKPHSAQEAEKVDVDREVRGAGQSVEEGLSAQNERPAAGSGTSGKFQRTSDKS